MTPPKQNAVAHRPLPRCGNPLDNLRPEPASTSLQTPILIHQMSFALRGHRKRHSYHEVLTHDLVTNRQPVPNELQGDLRNGR
jgi:hypothetical protein